MRILYITTIGETMGFFRSFIRELLDEGHTVDIATNELGGVSVVPPCYREWGCRVYAIPTSRSPLDRGNLKAIGEIRRIAAGGKYDLVHCHTPNAAACTRLACRPLRQQQGQRLFYTAHGFHFYNGAPLKNWLIFYPVEKWLSRYTDVLFTINKEDYNRAKTEFHAKRTVYIPGIGYDPGRTAVCWVDRAAKRAELGVSGDDFLLLCVARDAEAVAAALERLEEQDGPGRVVCVAVGDADVPESVAAGGCVRLLGSRNDLDELCEIVDCFVAAGKGNRTEPAALEAMAAGLPLIWPVGNGVEGWARDGVSGCRVEDDGATALAAAIRRMRDDGAFRECCGAHNCQEAKTLDVRAATGIKPEDPGDGFSHLYSIAVRQAKRAELGFKPDDYVIISVGEVNENKNHQVIVRAISAIDDDKLKYVIVGRGNQEESLKALAKQCGVSNRVILTGFRTDVRDLLWMSDCFAFPSKREGLGIAALEGMAAGLPVIAHKIGGIPDYVIDGQTGWLCDSNTPEEYTGIIQKARECTLNRGTLAAKCAEFERSYANSIMYSVYRECGK